MLKLEDLPPDIAYEVKKLSGHFKEQPFNNYVSTDALLLVLAEKVRELKERLDNETDSSR